METPVAFSSRINQSYDPSRITSKTMTERGYLINCLAEELFELAEAASLAGMRLMKITRFGEGEIEPGQTLTNIERVTQALLKLHEETRDVKVVAEMLLAMGPLFVYTADEIIEKESKLAKFLKYSENLGIVKSNYFC